MLVKSYDKSVEINHNPNCPNIPDHLYIILIIGCSGSDKISVLLNLIKHQRPVIDKIYLNVKDPFESEYQLLLNEREKVLFNHEMNPKSFVDYSQTIDDVCQNLEDYDPRKKRKVLIVIDYMIADMEVNKTLKPRVSELFMRGRKINIISKCLKL